MLENLIGRDYLTDLVDERITLNCILKKEGMMMWIGFIWNRTKSSVGSFWM
jgi:hypothetical protein